MNNSEVFILEILSRKGKCSLHELSRKVCGGSSIAKPVLDSLKFLKDSGLVNQNMNTAVLTTKGCERALLMFS